MKSPIPIVTGAYSHSLVVGLVVSCLAGAPAWAEVQVRVEQHYGSASIEYECTAGEVVRAWALDVTVDEGRIVGISDFFKGACTTTNRGYGIFPAAFRDHITVGSGNSINWDTAGYTPLASVADYPGDTLPGMGSKGVTLEFGALWNADHPATIPASSGTLCTLQLSEGAQVSVTANSARGGVVASNPDMILAPVFSGTYVQPPQILDIAASNGYVQVTFIGGELVRAGTPGGEWIATGNSSGHYQEPAIAKRFFCVSASPVWPMPAITGLSITNGQVTVSFIAGALEAASAPDGPWSSTGNRSGTHQEPVMHTKFYRVSSP